MLKPTEFGVRRTFEVHSEVLANGLKVLLVENPSLPTVSLGASVLAGARHEPESKAGLAIMVSRLLDEGTENRTSLEIADAIESVGGAIESDGSFERIVVAAGVLKKDVDYDVYLGLRNRLPSDDSLARLRVEPGRCVRIDPWPVKPSREKQG